eukprot:SAG31_NODE_3269_length_4478_cov_2.680521_7_plen_87_part_00
MEVPFASSVAEVLQKKTRRRRRRRRRHRHHRHRRHRRHNFHRLHCSLLYEPCALHIVELNGIAKTCVEAISGRKTGVNNECGESSR